MNAWKTTFPFGARPIFRGELLVSGIIESKIAILQFYGHPDCSTVLIHSRRRSVSKGPGAASLKGSKALGLWTADITDINHVWFQQLQGWSGL